MLSIASDLKNEIIINKSRFINYLLRVETIEDIKEKLELVKHINKEATHYCYAYILGSIKHFSDNGEPSGTAGMPMLNVLESNKLDHILAITVRYFGGIKLGAGGLVRAYTKSVTSTLEKASIINLENGYSFKISCNFDKKNIVENALKNITIDNIFFDDKINYSLSCNEEKYKSLEIFFKHNNIEIKDLKNIMIKSD